MKLNLFFTAIGIVLLMLASCKKTNVEATISKNSTPAAPKLQKISGTAYPDAWYKGRRYYFEVIRDCDPISKGNCLEDVVITARQYQLFVGGIENAIASNTVPSFFNKADNYRGIIPDSPFGNDVVKMLSSGKGSIKLVRTSKTKVILLGSDAAEVDEANAAFAIPIIAQD